MIVFQLRESFLYGVITITAMNTIWGLTVKRFKIRSARNRNQTRMSNNMLKISVHNYPLVIDCQRSIIIVLPTFSSFVRVYLSLAGGKGVSSPIATKDTLTGDLDVGSQSVRAGSLCVLSGVVANNDYERRPQFFFEQRADEIFWNPVFVVSRNDYVQVLSKIRQHFRGGIDWLRSFRHFDYPSPHLHSCVAG
ncbi:MAG: hypothetical protein G01um101420_536 [Parcubacteria group bacterium Gr01-1014_20]|nr:MAG: hypothetical protein G01um101420_536 [Parcubacteria group bacterium Gr01-1014_20]